MIRISLSYLYKLSERFHPLTHLQGEQKLSDIFLELILAHDTLKELFTSSVYTFRTSRQSAENLFALLKKYESPTNEQLGGTIARWEIITISKAAQAFEMALNDELATMPAYLVTPKGGYDVNVLTLAPETLFPPDLVTLIPETKYDVEQAAKCLAFEVPTAAGFHLHRINEAVLHQYWDVVTNGASRPNGRSIAAYLTALGRRRKSNPKIKATLRQIKDLHRNPLVHTEESLASLQEAIELYGIIISIISKMLAVIKGSRTPTVNEQSLEAALT